MKPVPPILDKMADLVLNYRPKDKAKSPESGRRQSARKWLEIMRAGSHLYNSLFFSTSLTASQFWKHAADYRLVHFQDSA